jgi:hypothetical protein
MIFQTSEATIIKIWRFWVAMRRQVVQIRRRRGRLVDSIIWISEEWLKPSQASQGKVLTGGRRLAQSASRRPPVC